MFKKRSDEDGMDAFQIIKKRKKEEKDGYLYVKAKQELLKAEKVIHRMDVRAAKKEELEKKPQHTLEKFGGKRKMSSESNYELYNKQELIHEFKIQNKLLITQSNQVQALRKQIREMKKEILNDLASLRVIPSHRPRFYNLKRKWEAFKLP